MRAFALVVVLARFAGPACGEMECATDPMDDLLDPQTGACVLVSNLDGCTYCISESQRCVVGDAPKLDYARCRGPCLATEGCRAGYEGGRFFACWSTAPSGPVHAGACVGLDARACSRHDNCASWFTAAPDGSREFDHCANELPVSVMAADR